MAFTVDLKFDEVSKKHIATCSKCGTELIADSKEDIDKMALSHGNEHRRPNEVQGVSPRP